MFFQRKKGDIPCPTGRIFNMMWVFEPAGLSSLYAYISLHTFAFGRLYRLLADTAPAGAGAKPNR
jgi:hypothetical protein